MMNVVVAYIPANYGMLLSRSREGKLGGAMQIDICHMLLCHFLEMNREYFTEKLSFHVVSDQNNRVNHSIYAIDSDLGCCIMSIDGEVEQENTPLYVDNNPEGIWKLYFDGSCSKEGSGEGVVIISQANEKKLLYYKLEFKDNNNVAEYEALALGLEALRNMNITQLVVSGDSELVVEKVGNVWWSK